MRCTKKTLHFSLTFLLFSTCSTSCIPGGIITKGGDVNGLQIIPEATLTGGAPYQIVCMNPEEETKKEETEEKETENNPVQSYIYIDPALYKGGCEQVGQHSAFYLFNIIRVTPPLDAEYAIGSAVQRVEGDTMIRIRAWHEIHYYSILGNVSVFKIKGDVIRYTHGAKKRGQR